MCTSQAFRRGWTIVGTLILSGGLSQAAVIKSKTKRNTLPLPG